MNKSRDVHAVQGLEGRVLVDGFKLQSPAVEAYFLSHFHGDHYDGLNENFQGPALIHCSCVTGALVVQELGVDPCFVRTYEFGEAAHVCGAKVTFIDANHCPGAAMLLFELDDGAVHLHCGDMRYDARMQREPALLAVRGRLDRLYLDTTYCHPKHVFPTQQESIDRIVDTVANIVHTSFQHVYGDDTSATDLADAQAASPAARRAGAHGDAGTAGSKPQCLILLSAYKIGKERVLLQVAERTGCLICVDEKKMKVISALGLTPAELARFTSDKAATPIHVCRMGFAGELFPFFRPNFTNIERYLKAEAPWCSGAVAVIPSGWADSSNYNKRNHAQRRGHVCVEIVPYSEHSNFTELCAFVGFLKPRHVVPTVYANDKDRLGMLKRLSSLIDKTSAKRAFVSAMGNGEGRKSTAKKAREPSRGLKDATEKIVVGVDQGQGTGARAWSEEDCCEVLCIVSEDEEQIDGQKQVGGGAREDGCNGGGHASMTSHQVRNGRGNTQARTTSALLDTQVAGNKVRGALNPLDIYRIARGRWRVDPRPSLDPSRPRTQPRGCPLKMPYTMPTLAI